MISDIINLGENADEGIRMLTKEIEVILNDVSMITSNQKYLEHFRQAYEHFLMIKERLKITFTQEYTERMYI